MAPSAGCLVARRSDQRLHTHNAGAAAGRGSSAAGHVHAMADVLVAGRVHSGPYKNGGCVSVTLEPLCTEPSVAEPLPRRRRSGTCSPRSRLRLGDSPRARTGRRQTSYRRGHFGCQGEGGREKAAAAAERSLREETQKPHHHLVPPFPAASTSVSRAASHASQDSEQPLRPAVMAAAAAAADCRRSQSQTGHRVSKGEGCLSARNAPRPRPLSVAGAIVIPDAAAHHWSLLDDDDIDEGGMAFWPPPSRLHLAEMDFTKPGSEPAIPKAMPGVLHQPVNHSKDAEFVRRRTSPCPSSGRQSVESVARSTSRRTSCTQGTNRPPRALSSDARQDPTPAQHLPDKPRSCPTSAASSALTAHPPTGPPTGRPTPNRSAGRHGAMPAVGHGPLANLHLGSGHAPWERHRDAYEDSVSEGDTELLFQQDSIRCGSGLSSRQLSIGSDGAVSTADNVRAVLGGSETPADLEQCGGAAWPGHAAPSSGFAPGSCTEGGSQPSRRKSLLSVLKHRDSKKDRLRHLTSKRRSRLPEDPDVQNDRLLKHEAVEFARELFVWYFKVPRHDHEQHDEDGRPPSASLHPRAECDVAVLLEALADFGLQARTRPEKIALQEVVAAKVQEGHISFGDFCRIVEEARARLRAARSSMVLFAWRRSGALEAGGLRAEQLTALLKELQLFDEADASMASIAAQMIDELPFEDALVGFHEVERMVSNLRERSVAKQRGQERELKQRFELDDSTFSALRCQLLKLHASFEALDADESGTLDASEVSSLIFELGCLSRRPPSAYCEAGLCRTSKDIVAEVLGSQGDEINFPAFLRIVEQLRTQDRKMWEADVQTLFARYDADRSGSLDLKETFGLLADLGVQPRTPQEQESIAELLEECDADGSGQLEPEELLHMVQQIGERWTHMQRKQENDIGRSLGFQPRQLNALRHAFEELDSDGSGLLDLSEAEKAMELSGWRVPRAHLLKIIEELDEDETCVLNFPLFLKFMRRAEEDMRQRAAHQRRRRCSC
eukprot:TRINITY_DN2534_c2_g1_i2.p1 TRINITY_DN2534_c2_g1~~TRINITY_DN2534_c2_g1_i2.p1  ORF type:complete len:1009 (-),score=206.22 TRINITY_DN2534_c2_g1_i2:56-3082(-)